MSADQVEKVLANCSSAGMPAGVLCTVLAHRNVNITENELLDMLETQTARFERIPERDGWFRAKPRKESATESAQSGRGACKCEVCMDKKKSEVGKCACCVGKACEVPSNTVLAMQIVYSEDGIPAICDMGILNANKKETVRVMEQKTSKEAKQPTKKPKKEHVRPIIPDTPGKRSSARAAMIAIAASSTRPGTRAQVKPKPVVEKVEEVVDVKMEEAVDSPVAPSPILKEEDEPFVDDVEEAAPSPKQRKVEKDVPTPRDGRPRLPAPCCFCKFMVPEGSDFFEFHVKARRVGTEVIGVAPNLLGERLVPTSNVVCVECYARNNAKMNRRPSIPNPAPSLSSRRTPKSPKTKKKGGENEDMSSPEELSEASAEMEPTDEEIEDEGAKDVANEPVYTDVQLLTGKIFAMASLCEMEEADTGTLSREMSRLLDAFHWTIGERGVEVRKKRSSPMDTRALVKAVMRRDDHHFARSTNARGKPVYALAEALQAKQT